MPIKHRFTLPLLSTLISLLPGLALAQSRAKDVPGYVVTTAGDTLRGLISIPHFVTEQGISVRPAAKAPARQLSAAEVRVIGLQDQRRFLRQTVAASRNPETGVVDSATILVQHLVGGAANLYRYNHNAARHAGRSEGASAAVQYFIDQQGSSLVPLRRPTYEPVLTALFKDCPPVVQALLRTGFTEDKLGNLTLRYDTLCQATTPATDYRPRHEPLFGQRLLSVRVAAQQTKFYHPSSYYFHPDQAERITRPALGLEMRFANAGPWSVIVGGTYARQRGESTRTETAVPGTLNAGQPLVLTSTIDVKTLQVPVLARYTLGHGRLRPYLAGGLVLGWLFDDHTSLAYAKLTYIGTAESFYRDDVVSLRADRGPRFTLGTALRLGLQVKNAGRISPLLELQYGTGRDREQNPGALTNLYGQRESMGYLHYQSLSLTTGIEF
ncbi:autotransporter outer membrane beta-barrel domain-containing protein [Hymenobacter sp. BT635]|uniref:Autotransporter outer membrane beta-barrel domain-containing protein n=1 Tax=Hymenobacter nitidus TaxID=2880929 RepID=A0ABS8AFZ7_9BACT|nr:autotransporter outer membrane beta-barrel domain-containing protein [Hymenobacter nitidus]MCB2379277.1 autotransporter outer membrane beta-barrel domain-containing protein [Hymenobacter nitidus]